MDLAFKNYFFYFSHSQKKKILEKNHIIQLQIGFSLFSIYIRGKKEPRNETRINGILLKIG